MKKTILEIINEKVVAGGEIPNAVIEYNFEIPKEMSGYGHNAEKLQELAQSKLTDGWIADKYFGSQTSFFSKDEKHYARCTIRRWVDVAKLRDK